MDGRIHEDGQTDEYVDYKIIEKPLTCEPEKNSDQLLYSYIPMREC